MVLLENVSFIQVIAPIERKKGSRSAPTTIKLNKGPNSRERILHKLNISNPQLKAKLRPAPKISLPPPKRALPTRSVLIGLKKPEAKPEKKAPKYSVLMDDDMFQPKKKSS